MHILIISDAYPPMRTSCAIQIYDLAQAFIEQGHQVSIIIPAHSQKKLVEISNADGPTVYSVRCFKTKDVGYARRTIAEFINPFIIGFHLTRNQPFSDLKIDGIAWYSPTIFWGPLVKRLKEKFKCKAYLILRDIFPDWALDLGLLKKNSIYIFFKRVEKYQYKQADYIGVQSPNNVEYLNFHNPQLNSTVEVLWNWIRPKLLTSSPLRIEDTKLAHRNVLVYAGNMGVAQNMDALLDLARQMQNDANLGFLFIGRGSEKNRLELKSNEMRLTNTLFLDEIPNEQLVSLLRQCRIGMIALHPNHLTHNIPGKFLAYLQAGLPTMAFLNEGNDLISLIKSHEIGVSICSNSPHNISFKINQAIALKAQGKNFENKCQAIIQKNFSSSVAAEKVIRRLSQKIS